MLSRLATILLGLLLITVITPLSQFLTINTVNLDLETATPVGWAVGLLFSLILSFAVVRWISGMQWVDRRNVVLLYCMLTIAAPVMNIGLVRQIYISMMVPVFEYMVNGTNTYHTRYHSGDPRWEPLPPNAEALAWHKSYRLQILLEDRDILNRRSSAQDTIENLVGFRATLAVPQDEADLSPELREARQRELAEHRSTVAENLPLLGVDEIGRLQRLITQDAASERAAAELGLQRDDLDGRLEQAAQVSRLARERLEQVLPFFGEEHAEQLPEVMREKQTNDPSSFQRINRDRARQPVEALEQLQQRIDLLGAELGVLLEATAAFDDRQAAEVAQAVSAAYAGLPGFDPQRRLVTLLRRDMSTLSSEDEVLLRGALTERYRQLFQEISGEDYSEIRASLLLRMSTEERNFILQAARERKIGQPNQNMRSLQATVWVDPESQRQARDQGFWYRVVNVVFPEIPWQIWVGPLVRWFLLLTVFFLTLMCLAEWLRRKWIERENLAFPLVEIADHVIRHDLELEHAEDVHKIRRRKTMFNWMFLAGVLVGFTWVFFDAMHHHQVMDAHFQTSFNVSAEIFTGGTIQKMDRVFLVLSPIVIGIAFLISLEISFSIWVLFFIYQAVLLVIREAVPDAVFAERIYLGYGGGRNFPFQMEQLLGACVALSTLSLIKAVRAKAPAEHPTLGSYVSPMWTRLGLGLLPVIIVALLWDMGITNILYLVLVGALFLAQIVAMARVRAETGLHTTHVFYDFFKIPMVFGLTGWLGSRVFTLTLAIAVLPLTLLGRLLPQQLENIELARRHDLNYRTLAWASLLSFLVALAVGMLSFIVMAYFFGSEFYWASGVGAIDSYGAIAYMLWVSHFLGEPGLEAYTSPVMIRVWAMIAGFAVYAGLSILRSRILGFPLHPIGYFLILASLWFPFISPYEKYDTNIGAEGSLLWGSVFVAWICKKLIIKYGGMNTYKSTKPVFIGLVIGAIFCVFLVNMTDLVLSMRVEALGPDQFSDPVNQFVDVPAYSPKVY